MKYKQNRKNLIITAFISSFIISIFYIDDFGLLIIPAIIFLWGFGYFFFKFRDLIGMLRTDIDEDDELNPSIQKKKQNDEDIKMNPSLIKKR